jgi:UPF0755 protein
MDFLERFFGGMLSVCALHVARFSRQWIMGLLILVLVACGYWVFAAPSTFVPGTIVIIAPGASVQTNVVQLAEAHVIAHPTVLRFLIRLKGDGNQIQEGAYKFNTKETVLTVLYRLITAQYDLPLTRITFVEGATVQDMATQAAIAFPDVSTSTFLSLGNPYQGYLFPDTYFFPYSADTSTLITAMQKNFDAKIAPLSGQIAASGHSLSDIVTMASLVEKEARSSTDKRIVAGILWNRIRHGMPLQVDAVFGYINNRDIYAPSLSDLTINSPYNTYLHKGLPPGPIDNPGLDSLEAAINPTQTNYLYYLTGRDGLMHYATTYAQHQANLKKYL